MLPYADIKLKRLWDNPRHAEYAGGWIASEWRTTWEGPKLMLNAATTKVYPERSITRGHGARLLPIP